MIRNIAKIALAIVLITLRFGAADAQEYCSLDKPQVAGSSTGAQLKFSVVCQMAPSPTTVRYPGGPLYVGVTLYKIEEEKLRYLVVPVVEGRTDHTYVKPVEIARPSTSKEVVVPLGDLGSNTHILLAIWDKKVDCPPDNQSEGCLIAGATLGDIDAFELPIPIDAWPRPVCNMAQLTKTGFFKWVETEGNFDPIGVPDRYASMLYANDCFMRFKDRAGLGFSVRQWRAQPLPKS